jgi:formylglycine-generating enzyme required for sulfatase activity
LEPNTDYYFRAYAINEKGLSYGESKSFKTKEQTGNPEIEYVLVEGGTFQMGSNDGRENERPVHNVTLTTYQISKYEITVAQFIEFLNAVKCDRYGYLVDPEFNKAQYIHMSSYECAVGFSDGQFVFKGSRYAETPDCPVAEVTWYGAYAYCRWAGGHLPTEAQWEYAAHGGKYSKGYIFSGSNDISEVAWYKRTYTNKTNPVGQKQPNELGLYDMTGNVWEWCADLYDSYSSDDQTNPTGGTTWKYRVFRGGSYVNDTDISYVTYRGFTDMYVSDWITGFRIARN